MDTPRHYPTRSTRCFASDDVHLDSRPQPCGLIYSPASSPAINDPHTDYRHPVTHTGDCHPARCKIPYPHHTIKTDLTTIGRLILLTRKILRKTSNGKRRACKRLILRALSKLKHRLAARSCGILGKKSIM